MMPVAAASLLLFGPPDPISASYQSLVTRGAAPGIVWAQIRDGKVIRHGEYGYADLENKVRVKRESRFEIGSMTKQFTSAVIVLLAKEGKISLNDAIGTYFPTLPESWRPLTIRRLLSHTAGLKDYLGSFNIMETRLVPPKEIIDKAGAWKLDFEPGSAWSYSNTGYLLATMLIEKIEGKSLAKSLEDRIFKPIGMKNTGSSSPDEVMPNRARAYLRGPKGWQNASPINPSLGNGAGYLVSTIDDLARWQRALQTGLIPTEDLWKPVEMNSGSSWNYGLGWFIEPIDGKTIVQHGGNTAGQSAHILIFPNRRDALVALTNGSGINPGVQSRYVAGLIDPNLSLESRSKSDPDLRQTLDFTVVLRRWSRGNYDVSMFSSEFQSALGTLRGLALRQALSSLGKSLKSLTYVDEDTFGKDRWARYLAVMPGGRVYLVLRWNPEGKLVQLDQVYAR